MGRHLAAAAESDEVEAAAADEFPRDEQRERLSELKKSAPRIDKDLTTWTVTDLMQRSLALGASEDAVEAALESATSKSILIDLVTSLEPPSPAAATVEMITRDPKTTSVEEMAAVLEDVGVLIIKGAADEATIAAVDEELELAGAWEISRNKAKKGRMQQEMLIKAPAARKLLTNEHVLAVTRHVLEPSCKRVALKELSAFGKLPPACLVLHGLTQAFVCRRDPQRSNQDRRSKGFTGKICSGPGTTSHILGLRTYCGQ